MYSDSEKVLNKIENLSSYLRNNSNRFCSLEEAFLAGYKRALEDAVDIMKEIKQNNSQFYNWLYKTIAYSYRFFTWYYFQLSNEL